MKEKLVMGLLIPDLTAQRFAEQFIGKLILAIPEATPSVYGYEEPLTRRFAGVSDALHWDYAFIWRSRGPLKCEGTVFKGNLRSHGIITVTMTSHGSMAERLDAFIRSVAVEMDAVFAYLHSVAAFEVANGLYDRWYPLSIGVTTHDLRKGIPDLPWLTIFGGEYRRMFGDEALKQAPAATSRALSPNHWLLKVTSELSDVSDNADYFFSQREAVKRDLGLQYFFGYEGMSLKKCIPDFIL